ncbi:MAG TPA: hypothetical protein VHA57_04845 [Actinomycetota bacterium]|nr:hypothetical protein [Actinomycetota bacterium]
MEETSCTYVFAGGKGTRMDLPGSQSKLLLPLWADGIATPLVVVVVRQLFSEWARIILVSGHAGEAMGDGPSLVPTSTAPAPPPWLPAGQLGMRIAEILGTHPRRWLQVGRPTSCCKLLGQELEA